jgi:hypothetical protein
VRHGGDDSSPRSRAPGSELGLLCGQIKLVLIRDGMGAVPPTPPELRARETPAAICCPWCCARIQSLAFQETGGGRSEQRTTGGRLLQLEVTSCPQGTFVLVQDARKSVEMFLSPYLPGTWHESPQHTCGARDKRGVMGTSSGSSNGFLAVDSILFSCHSTWDQSPCPGGRQTRSYSARLASENNHIK